MKRKFATHSHRAIRQLHAKGTDEFRIQETKNIIISHLLPFLLLLLISPHQNPSSAAHQFLPPPGLLLLRQRLIGLDCPDGRDQGTGGVGDGGYDAGAVRGGAIRALPVDRGGEGLRRQGEARRVPGGGAGAAQHHLRRRRRHRLADHATPVGVAWEIDGGGHHGAAYGLACRWLAKRWVARRDGEGERNGF